MKVRRFKNRYYARTRLLPHGFAEDMLTEQWTRLRLVATIAFNYRQMAYRHLGGGITLIQVPLWLRAHKGNKRVMIR